MNFGMQKNKRKKSIGIFDSGFGGLNIMKGIVKELPRYNFVYLGDTARVPYGTRSKEVVYEFTTQAIDFLFNHNCELIIIACNTASSDALRKIQQGYLPKKYPGKRVLGVVIPVAEQAALETKNGRVGVIATPATVKSRAFARELIKANATIKVFQNACPLLVPIVEAGEKNSEVTNILLKKYLKPLVDKKIDTLILGCTHYGILRNTIKKIVGSNITIVCEEKIVAKKLKDYLHRHPEMDKRLEKNAKNIFFSTDLTDKFMTLGSVFIGKKIKVKKITI